VTGTREKALALLGALVLEDGRRWGDVAAPFQWEDAAAVLDPVGLPYHFLTRSRGSSKTADLAGIALATMLAQLPNGARLYGLAADRDQGRLMLDSIEGYTVRTPELRGAVKVEAFRATASRTGSTLEVLAADAPGAWGLRPHFLIVDELAQWATTPGPRRLWEAVTTAAAKIAGCRMVCLTSAGDPAHWSHRVLEHAVADPLWRVREVRGPAPWLDEARLAEQRRRLPESSYRRLFQNEWTASEDRLTAADDLAACTVLEGPLPPEPGTRYVIGLDVGTVNDRTVAIVAHAEPVTRAVEDGEVVAGVRVLVDRVQAWSGSRAKPVQLAEVGDWLDYVAHEYAGATVVFDPHQAVELTQRLERRGVRCEKFDFTAASVGRLALTLYQLLRSRSLALPEDAELLEELANVRLRETSPGTYRLDHDPDKHDDRAIALALAAHHLVERSGQRSAGAVAGAVRSFRGVPSWVARTGDDERDERGRMTYAAAKRRAPDWRDPRYE
jgi:phage terminase large subunit-like protein